MFRSAEGKPRIPSVMLESFLFTVLLLAESLNSSVGAHLYTCNYSVGAYLCTYNSSLDAPICTYNSSIGAHLCTYHSSVGAHLCTRDTFHELRELRGSKAWTKFFRRPARIVNMKQHPPPQHFLHQQNMPIILNILTLVLAT